MTSVKELGSSAYLYAKYDAIPSPTFCGSDTVISIKKSACSLVATSSITFDDNGWIDENKLFIENLYYFYVNITVTNWRLLVIYFAKATAVRIICSIHQFSQTPIFDIKHLFCN